MNNFEDTLDELDNIKIDIFARFEEKNIDKDYVQVNNCPVCNFGNLYFCWYAKSIDNINNVEIVKECSNCGEIFHAIYDKNKKLIETRHGGYGVPEREKWLRKQKLTKLLEKP